MNSAISRLAVTILLIAVSAAAPRPFAAETYAGPELSGREEVTGAWRVDDGLAGLLSTTRLALRARPSDRLSFYAEASLGFAFGALSETAALIEAGLIASEALPPGDDPRRDFSLDQAYAAVLLGPVDLRAGIVPVAWGSAYVFNPTARLGAPASPMDESEVEEGYPAIELTLSLPRGCSLTGYAAFRDRDGELWPDEREGEIGALPAGLKLQYRGEGFDLAAMVLRETLSFGDSGGTTIWAGLDLSGSLGGIDLYLESAYRVTGGAGEDRAEGLELSAGLVFPLGFGGLVLRAEYAYLGTGEGEPDEYDWAGILAGTRAVLGRNYFFALLERQSLDWAIRGGLLANGDDGSAAFAGEFAWTALTNLELGLFCRFFVGEDGSEFDGRFQPGPGFDLDLARPLLGATLVLSF